jgi:hypothetical protein
MAMRDLELTASRLQALYEILQEHHTKPMRVLDLAWGGVEHRSLWKIDQNVFRLVVAHDEASAYVDDLVETRDLQEVERGRYIWTGRQELRGQLRSMLDAHRSEYGHLDYESRGAAA